MLVCDYTKSSEFFRHLLLVFQVTSYGGKLTYTVLFQLPRGRSEGRVEADVKIEVNVTFR